MTDPFLDDDDPAGEAIGFLKVMAYATACVLVGVAAATSLFVAGYLWLTKQISRNG